MLKESLYKQVSAKLFELFFVDDSKYGRQQEDGSYKLVREKLSLVTIDDMLLNHKSLLTYQEVHTLNIAFIRWICIDLDISKKEIDQNAINSQNLELVKESATDICDFLKESNIPYLLEFSGRRGFHIWIIFDELQRKEVGYNLVNFILSQVRLKQTINVDRFPKTRDVSKNTKRVGFGVKLPLSQNKSSNKLSFFLKDTSEFLPNQEMWLSIVNNEFLEKQLSLLETFIPISSEQINFLLKDYKSTTSVSKYSEGPYLKNKKISLLPTEPYSLDNILLSLKQCGHLRNLLTDYQLGLSGKDRSILVGLLGSLKTTIDSDLGYKLLLELFSKIKGFRKEITEEKLKFIEYFYPITCSQLGKCDYCNCKTITSPVELINGVALENRISFSIENISKKVFFKIKEALIKYSIINDEIPLFNTLKKLENVSHNEITKKITEVYQGHIIPNSEVYEFQRNEGDKVRLLYSLNHINNIVSTYFLFILNNLYYTEISDNSYGYKIAPSFSSTSIFSNWFINWAIFSKKVSQILDNIEFADYYLIKVDIKSFYDKINLQRLKIKLYEEAPEGIKEKLIHLEENGRFRYKNIVEYLIKISQLATNDFENGLPQGPAYARYLAELYLLGLDKLIENQIIKDKRREFYYRFVDDIFVFVETQEKAEEVLKSIDKWILLNSLELNSSKTEISNVKDYKESNKFKKFEEDIKYTINKANKKKALLPEKEIQTALAKLGDLTNDVKFGLKDNLRFFYYQFSGDFRLNHIKDKLIKFLPFSNTGRGTLYMMFYTDLINTQPERFWSISKEHHKLFGLSLGHYLNTILLNADKVLDNIEVIMFFLKSIEERTDLNNSDKALIITLSMKYGFKLSKIFINSCSKTLIHSAMETPDIKYTISDYQFLEENLKEKDKKEFVQELYRIILKNPLDRDVCEKLARYSITRFSEWKQLDDVFEFKDDEDSIIHYYHCICFFSLFENSPDNTALLTSWKNLLSKSANFQLTKSISFDWLNRAVEHPKEDFSSKSSYALIMSHIEGSELNKHKCKNGFLKKFQEILSFLLFSKEISLKNNETETAASVQTTLFEKWLADSNVRLYPSHDNICIKNLALNGIIILENDTHLFVKVINEETITNKFDYLNIDNQFENEIEISKSTQLDIFNKFSDFKSYLTGIVVFTDKSRQFMKQFNVKYPVYYKSPYSINEFPLVPFYSLFNEKISPLRGANQRNDIVGFWENIEYLSQIKNQELLLVPDISNPYNFKAVDINDKFFPKSSIVIESTEDKLNFIFQFIKNVGSSDINDIHCYQYFWSKTIWTVLIQKKSKSNLIEFLSVHFSNFYSENEMPRDILFSVNDRTIVENDNLESFYVTLRTAFVNFQTQVFINEFELVELLDNEVAILKEIIDEKYSVELKEFKKIKIDFKSEFDPIQSGTVRKILVNDKFAPVKTTLLFNRDPIGFYNKSIYELSVLATTSDVFSYESEQYLLLYIPELEISKAFERISERKNLLDRIVGKASQYIKLYPINENYKFAEINYNDSDFTRIEGKLRNHYTSTNDIKERVVSWLSLFNETVLEGSSFKNFLDSENIKLSKVHRALLELVNKHHSVSDKALLDFRNKIQEYKKDGCLLFPLKHPYRDKNGLYRMLNKSGFEDRELDFEKDFKELSSKDCGSKKLVILVDTAISGQQAEKALNHYTKDYKNEVEFKSVYSKLSIKDKYFEFSNIEEAKIFISNLKNIKQIVFLTPIITDAFKAKMESLEIFKEKTIIWNFTDELKDNSYNWGKSCLDIDNEKILENLIKDHELINRIFKIEELSLYKKDVKKLEELNILLRIGSLPTKHIKLFSLTPKSGHQSLFDYVPNWD